MSINIDSLLSNVRSVMRGEAQGSLKMCASLLAAVIIWLSVWTVSGFAEQSRTSLKSQQGRLNTLLLLSDEYSRKSQGRHGRSNDPVDVAAVFAMVSETMSLGSRVNRITPDGRNQSVELNRLYADEFVELQKNLAERGVIIMAAEIRALSAGRERLFTVSAVIGPSNT